MALIICGECGKEYSDKATACPNCGCPTSDIIAQNNAILNLHSKDIVEDKLSKDEVIKHLTYAKELETTIFTYQNAYNNLQMRIDELGHRWHIDKPAKIFYDFHFFKIFFVLFAVLLILCCTIIEKSLLDIILIITIFPLFFGSEYLWTDLGISFGVALAITCLSGVIYVVFKKVKQAKLIKQYKERIEIDKKRVEKENEQIKILKQQQRDIQEEIDKNDFLLNKLYSMDIIFPKYRHMIAVITMLEYFESGRCSQLTGGHGAYDTYSYEEKQNMIIGRLDVVISKLDDIKNTQYMLYEAIQESNAISEGIYRQSEAMIESNRKIAENSALTAYNSDIIRRNTTISAYIDVFKY